jgi:hypothetical protein
MAAPVGEAAAVEAPVGEAAAVEAAAKVVEAAVLLSSLTGVLFQTPARLL